MADALGAELYAPRRPFIERALAGERVEFDQLMQSTGEDRQVHALYVPHQENGVTLGLYASLHRLGLLRGHLRPGRGLAPRLAHALPAGADGNE